MAVAATGPATAGTAALSLARSGVLALTGWPDAPAWPPLGLPARLDVLVQQIERRTTERGRPVRVSWEAALAGRAALLGLGRQGRTSSNGSCRLLSAGDGWVALNLPRADDVELLPALTGRAVTDPWTDAASAAAGTNSGEFVSQARLLGLAAAALPGQAEPRGGPCRVTDQWPRRAGARDGLFRVVDLSSLWAGPTVARILAEAGAAVTKIESTARPDGARATPAFYRWMHPADETTVQVDLRSEPGRQQAAELIDAADVVIEGSRPRALEQLGLGPEDLPGGVGRVWLSITGYGRDEPGREWVAFGDDAAVAGGLVGWDGGGEPVFCGDAIADPITGLIGAAAVLSSLEAGGGQLIDLAMSRVAAEMAASPERGVSGAATMEADGAGGWLVQAGNLVEPVRTRPPRLEWISGG